ncbi:MAG: type II toxin-antitoxin system Phd/YefM family antitoxin [Algicola sp.]|jgi:PHD/YefM family antitoxin component YafN of YafNO toxin-antitoxin module|nr:type II toxin-antitoxin system Phd/YefM family antitoxin [Algicola sp.]
MNTETITYLKENANNLELDSELLITKNGKPAFVIQSVEDYEYQKESLALLKLLQLSEKSLEEGEFTLDQAFEKFI